MTNDDVYAAGLLTKALDPATQPPEIRAFLRAEIDLLLEIIPPAARLLDLGCGTGRHLALLSDRLGLGAGAGLGVGVDYERSYIVEAHRHAHAGHLYFITADAAAIPLRASFDYAVCLTNTWGTMSDKLGVLREMRRLAPGPGTRLLSVYAEASLAPRREWYRRLGHVVVEESDEYLMSEGGFRSEHFSEARLASLVGDAVIQPLAGIAYIVRF